MAISGGYEDLTVTVLEQMLDLLWLEQWINGHEHAAGLGDAVKSARRFEGLGQIYCNPRLFLKAKREESCAYAVRFCLEFLVAELLIFSMQSNGCAVRPLLRATRKRVMKQNRHG